MFSFGDNSQQQQNTPFFEDHEEKPSLFSSQISDQPSAFDLFNQVEGSLKFSDQSFGLSNKNLKKSKKGSQSKKSIILELDEFDKGEVFKSLQESYEKQSQQVIKFFQSCGEVKQKQSGNYAEYNRLVESEVQQVVVQNQQNRKGEENLFGKIKKKNQNQERLNLLIEEKQIPCHTGKQQQDSKNKKMGEIKKQSLLDIIRNKKSTIHPAKQISSQSFEEVQNKQKKQKEDQKCSQVQKEEKKESRKALKTVIEPNKNKIGFPQFSILRSSRIECKDKSAEQRQHISSLSKISDNIKLKKSIASGEVPQRDEKQSERLKQQKRNRDNDKKLDIKFEPGNEKGKFLEQPLKNVPKNPNIGRLTNEKQNSVDNSLLKVSTGQLSFHNFEGTKGNENQNSEKKSPLFGFSNLLGKKISSTSSKNKQMAKAQFCEQQGQKTGDKQKQREQGQLKQKEKPFFNLKMVKQKQKQKSESSGDQKCKKSFNLVNFKQKRQETTTLRLLKDNNLKGFTFHRQEKPSNQYESKEERTPKFKAEEKLKNAEKIDTERIRRNDGAERTKEVQTSQQVGKAQRIDWQKYEKTVNELLEQISDAKKRYLQCQSNYKNIYLLLNKANYMLNEKFLPNPQLSTGSSKK